jgi:hypothetical protein
VASVITVGFAGAAIGTFVHASSVMDSAGAESIDFEEYERRIDRARTWQHTSWAIASAVGAGAVISGLLWLRSTRMTSVEVAATGSGGAVTIRGSF